MKHIKLFEQFEASLNEANGINKKGVFQYFDKIWKLHFDKRDNTVNITGMAEDYVDNILVGNGSQEGDDDVVYDYAVDWLELNKKKLNLNESNHNDLNTEVNRLISKYGLKIVYKIAKVIVPFGELNKKPTMKMSDLKKTMINGYGMKVGDFYEIADSEPNILKVIYDKFQARANADEEDRYK